MNRTEDPRRMLNAIPHDLGYVRDHSHSDLTLEFAYGKTNGFPTHVQGLEEALAYLRNAGRNLPDLRYFDIVIMPLAERGGYVVTYRGNSAIANDYDQRYVSFLWYADGKLRRFTEYWDTMEADRAFARRS